MVCLMFLFGLRSNKIISKTNTSKSMQLQTNQRFPFHVDIRLTHIFLCNHNMLVTDVHCTFFSVFHSSSEIKNGIKYRHKTNPQITNKLQRNTELCSVGIERQMPDGNNGKKRNRQASEQSSLKLKHNRSCEQKKKKFQRSILI